MRVALGCDHGGFALKDPLKALLASLSHDVIDVGCDCKDPVDYPAYAFRIAEEVASGAVDMGIAVCGTGIGVSLAANRVAGIRAAAVTNARVAQLSREHNNTNVLCLGARVTSLSDAEEIVRVWLATPFSGEARHVRRLQQIHARDCTP